jgi:hypothetical protein
MTGFNHGITGALIAITVKNPVLAVPLSFASHYLTDMIPHFGFKQDVVLGKKFNRFILFDFIFSLVLMVVLGLLFPQQKWLIWICMIAAAIPDIVWWIYRKSVTKWPKGLDSFTKMHFKWNAKSHVDHFYYDAIWFMGVFGIILLLA